jgi:hypothetical protein
MSVVIQMIPNQSNTEVNKTVILPPLVFPGLIHRQFLLLASLKSTLAKD